MRLLSAIVVLVTIILASCGGDGSQTSSTPISDGVPPQTEQSDPIDAQDLQSDSTSDSASDSASDSTSDSTSDSITLVGKFIDSPVSGLSFITSSGLSGITNAAGEFNYLDGDTVSFSIGPIELGSIRALPKITPFDLVGFELPSVDLDLSDLAGDILSLNSGNVSEFGTGVNMLIFLQSLDSNDNPDDGIEILATVARFFVQAAAALAFDQNTDDFITTFFVLFTQLVTNDILDRDAGATPVDKDDAILHFISNN